MRGGACFQNLPAIVRNRSSEFQVEKLYWSICKNEYEIVGLSVLKAGTVVVPAVLSLALGGIEPALAAGSAVVATTFPHPPTEKFHCPAGIVPLRISIQPNHP